MKKPNIGRELLDVPMGDMIRDMAFAIADAQLRLDENSIEVAQMLGGLKQVQGLDGNVNFEDSRVFFGKEKIRMLDAIDMYNASSDPEYRANILKELKSTFYEFDCTETNSTSLSQLVTNSNVTKLNEVYATKNFGEFYRYLGTTGSSNTKIFSPDKAPGLPKYEVPIKPAANVSLESYIYVPQRVSMLELGFSPTFYQFVDTIIEVKISITYTHDESYERSYSSTSEEKSKSGGVRFSLRRGIRANSSNSVLTSSVNASYSQKFSYSAEGSSLLRTKLVPIPPPAILEERIRALMEVAKEASASTTPSTTTEESE